MTPFYSKAYMLKILPIVLLLLLSPGALLAQAPQITQPPVAQTVTEGQTAQFTVAATGSNLVYQWLREGVPLVNGGRVSGALTSTLTITGALQADAGSYSVVVSVSGSPDLKVSSDGVLLKVNPPTPPAPLITQQPAPQTVTEGQNAQFSVVATGSNLLFQWSKDGVALVDGGRINGASTNTLIITGALKADEGSYSVVVTISGFPQLKATSDGALLKVDPPPPTAPQITQQPGGQIVAKGQNAQFTVTATGSNLIHQWYKDGVALINGGRIAGATAANLTITGAQALDEGSYSVVVSVLGFPALKASSSGALLQVGLAGTGSATAVTSGWATLNGTANPDGQPSTTYFEYGLNTGYGSTTYINSIGSGTAAVPVSFNIAGLSKGMTYHYRLVIVSGATTYYGADQTFTTPSVTSPPAWHSAQLTAVPNTADGVRTGAAHPSASLYFYKGTDSNVWASYWNGTQWAQAQLSSDANVDDWLSYGTSYGLLAYKGKDNKLWVAYWAGSAWAVAPLGSTPNVAGDVVMDDAWNLIYYRGTDSRVWVAYWTGTQWTQASLGGAVPVVGSLAVDGSHHIVYFQGGSSGNEMWCYYWSGAAWLQAQLSAAPNVGGSVAADTGGGLAYYRSSADNSAWCVYWNGSAWAYGQLDAAAAMGTSNSIAPLARNAVLYLNNNGQCAAEYWGGSSWGSTVLGDGGWGLTGGLSVQRSTNLVFTRRNDGNVVVFYYQ